MRARLFRHSSHEGEGAQAATWRDVRIAGLADRSPVENAGLPCWRDVDPPCDKEAACEVEKDRWKEPRELAGDVDKRFLGPRNPGNGGTIPAEFWYRLGNEPGAFGMMAHSLFVKRPGGGAVGDANLDMCR